MIASDEFKDILLLNCSVDKENNFKFTFFSMQPTNEHLFIK